MNRQSIMFMILAALVATSYCKEPEDLSKWNEGASETSFRTQEDGNQKGTDLKNFGFVGEKNLITTILQKVLEQVLPGLTEANIPSLSLGAAGSLSDVTLNVDNAEVVSVEGEGSFSVKNLSLAFDQITLKGQYDIISLTLPGPIEIFGQGDFFVNLEEIFFTTGLTIGLQVSNLTITDFPGFSLSLKKSTIDFENLMGGGPVGELLNSIISDALPQLIEAAQGELIANYGDEIADFLNPIINCMKSKPLKPLECLKPTS